MEKDNIEKAKSLYIKGYSITQIAEKMDELPAIIEEYLDDQIISEKDKALADIRTLDLDKLKKTASMSEKTEIIGHKLLHAADAVIDAIQVSWQDPEIAVSLNKTADSIAKLYTAFFNKGTQILNVNNPSNGSNFNKFMRD